MFKIEDIYFNDFDEALETAKQQNKFTPYNNLQICYYDGEEKITEYKNLISLPKNEIVKKLFELNTRIPTKINSKDQKEIEEQIENFKIYKEERYQKIVEEVKSLEIDFNQPLRFYISVDYGASVVWKTSELLKKIFENNSFQVCYEINDEITVMDDFKRAKSILQFKPHITININRLRNNFLNEKIFNFIWFMDPTLILFDETKITLRKRDFIFYIGQEIYDALLNKGIDKDKIISQYLTPDYTVFYEKKEIKREQKIIFIGNNYFDSFYPTKSYKDHPVVKELREIFNSDNYSNDTTEGLCQKYKSSIARDEHLRTFILPAIVREEIVKWMCTQNIVKAEVYGSGWKDMDYMGEHYKGNIDNTESLVNILNTAKYSLIVHANYIYIPKLFESCACGTIPIVYKSITTLDNFSYNDNVLFFSTKKELDELLNQEPLESPKQISDEISTVDIVMKIEKIISKVERIIE